MNAHEVEPDARRRILRGLRACNSFGNTANHIFAPFELCQQCGIGPKFLLVENEQSKADLVLSMRALREAIDIFGDRTDKCEFIPFLEAIRPWSTK
jgi:hypothetical protein